MLTVQTTVATWIGNQETWEAALPVIKTRLAVALLAPQLLVYILAM